MPVKYLNNRLESDHGKLKRLIKPTLAFKSGASAASVGTIPVAVAPSRTMTASTNRKSSCFSPGFLRT